MQYQEERMIKMNKVLLKINDEKELIYPCSGYILGIDYYSILFKKTFNIEEIKKIKNNHTDKKIFVSLNRVIFNDELNDYKSTLKKLDKLNLDGIIVGDVSALTYNFKTNIILDQAHLNNSYFSMNHYLKNGVKGFVLTNDITLDEINEIRTNTNAVLLKQVFGYEHLSTSKRKLITNYLKHFNIDNKHNSYEIKEEKSQDYYKIFEDYFGTHILSSKPINLLGYDLNVDYLVIDGIFIDNVKEVCEIYINNKIEKKQYLDNKYNAHEAFINTKTIYKVKKDEK